MRSASGLRKRSTKQSPAKPTRKRRRGFTDRLYVLNFTAVQIVVVMVVILTALSGVIGITDMSALSTIPPCAYTELGIHTAFIIWKSKNENMRKFNGVNRLTPETEEII